MKAIRRIVFALLIVIMVAGIFTIQSFAAVEASGTCGENLSWTFTSDGVLTISGTGNIDSAPWEHYRTRINTIIIEHGITRIGDNVFWNYFNATKVIIPGTVVSIDYYAFYNCSSLKEITLPEGIENISLSAFDNCSNLTKITLPASLSNFAAPNGCTSLKEIRVAEGNANYSSDEYGVLFNKNKTELICFPAGFVGAYTVPEGLTSIQVNAFTDCSGLTRLTIPASLGNFAAPNGCTSLKEIRVAEGNANYSSDEYGVLFNKNKTELIYFPAGFVGAYAIPEGVTNIGDGAFTSGSKLTKLTIPTSITNIGERAFSYCTGLREIIIPEGVTSIGNGAFYGCNSLISVNIPASVTAIGDEAFLSCDGLISVTIPEGVTSIGDRAFYWCESLREINIPASVTSIGDEAFILCSSVKKFRVAEGNANYSSDEYGVLFNKNKTQLILCPNTFTGAYTIPAGVTSIGDRAFYYCTSLTKLTLPAGVTTIGDNAFCVCGKLASINIPESVTYIGEYAFGSCSSLTEIAIPESVSTIGNFAFYWCTGLREITIPRGVTSIGEGTFLSCTSLTKLTIPQSVTSIGKEAFNFCTSLTELTIPESVTNIGNGAFSVCRALKKINIPEGITSIGSNTFDQCYSLTEIIIPKSVTIIDEWAFNLCTSLTNIKFKGNAPSMKNNIFTGVKATAYYPTGYDGWTQEVLSSGYGGTITWVGSHEFHKEEIIPGTAATCTRPGLTEGKKCSVCGIVILAQQTIPAQAHSKVIVPTKAPTCTQTGLTEGKKCSVCGIVILAQQTIKANGHSEIAVSGKAPTCSGTGLAAGKKCSVCGEILVKQETLPALGCSFINYTTYQNASCIADGTKIAECIHECGNTDVITVDGSRDPDAHSFGDWITEGNKSHRICQLCGHTETQVSTDSGNVEIESPEQSGTDFEADPVKPSDDQYILVEEAMDAVSGLVKEIVKTFDITLKNADGVHVQPDGTVKVKLPLDWEQITGYKVYRVNDDGTLTDMGAYRQGSHVVFETNHFSLYVIAEEANHTHEHQKRVTVPTCAEGGYTTYTCYCGDSYTTGEVGAKGHSEVTVPGKAATCTRVGLTDGKKCTVCGEVTLERQIIRAKGHSHEAKVTTSTCTTVGCTTYICSCGDIYITDEVAPKGHSEATVPGKAATCTKTGLTEGRKCSTCGIIIVEQKMLSALGHTYDDKVDGTCNSCDIHRETTENRTVMHMFRMYDPNSGEHFYTGSTEERENLVAAGWNYEGVGFTFSRTTGAPVYRLYEPVTGEHLYTMDEEEKASLIAQGWNLEGVAFNSAYDTEVPQYRLHNPYATRGAYHFTASPEERDNLIAAGWEYQGIGFYSSWK